MGEQDTIDTAGTSGQFLVQSRNRSAAQQARDRLFFSILPVHAAYCTAVSILSFLYHILYFDLCSIVYGTTAPRSRRGRIENRRELVIITLASLPVLLGTKC